MFRKINGCVTSISFVTVFGTVFLQNVNEGSLQFLQAHLDKLLNSKRVVPSTVTFYVRDVEKRENRSQGEEIARVGESFLVW